MMSQTISDLLDVIADPDAEFPQNRLSELSDLNSSQIELLRNRWGTLPVERRRMIVEELGSLADVHFELLLEETYKVALEDDDEEVRILAIRNLWECEDISLVPILIDGLKNSPSTEMRAVSAEALGSFALRNELKTLHNGMGEEILSALLDSAENDPELVVRRKAIESLGNTTSKKSRQLIQKAYEFDNDDVRLSAIIAMGRTADDRWGEILLNELTSPSAKIRAAAAQSCGELGYKTASNSLIDLIDDDDEDVRTAAIWALGQIGGRRARRAITDLLDQSEDPDEIEQLEEALDHLVFADSAQDLVMIDIDEPEDRER